MSESGEHSIPSRLLFVDFDDLKLDPTEKDISTVLDRAFGGLPPEASSLGIIAIRNIPGFFDSKQAFLPLAHKLAHLDPSYLEEKLSDPQSFYNAGWSHGKEKLGQQPDFSKASYYFNPVTDMPATDKEREEYPASYPCNKWPNEEELPQLQNFKEAAKSLGKIMHQVVVLLARHIDHLAESKVKGYPKNHLYTAMKETEKVKGRLLYYYPLNQDESDITIDSQRNSFDNWIGWHNDSGFLTALAGDLYINDTTGSILNKSEIDPDSGLYVTDRSGNSVIIKIPDDCMAVQIGECVQILTGGVVSATPHCVRGPRTNWSESSKIPVARISCACFIDTKPTFPLRMPQGTTREDILKVGVGRDKVPLLDERWLSDGMTFGDFLQKSFEKYYANSS